MRYTNLLIRAFAILQQSFLLSITRFGITLARSQFPSREDTPHGIALLGNADVASPSRPPSDRCPHYTRFVRVGNYRNDHRRRFCGRNVVSTISISRAIRARCHLLGETCAAWRARRTLVSRL